MIRILDTNVLLDRDIEEVIASFSQCDIIIPLAVIQELETFKSTDDNRGVHARRCIRWLDQLRNQGKLWEGIPLTNGNTLKVEINCRHVDIPAVLDQNKTDTRILMIAKELSKTNEDVKVVTQDICERVIADVIGVEAEDYNADDIQELYTGKSTIEINADDVQELYEHKEIKTTSFEQQIGRKPYPNEYITMFDAYGTITYGRFDKKARSILKVAPSNAWNIKPAKNNPEQIFLMDLLLNDDIKLITVVGKAGCGKTLLTLAAGLKRVVEDKRYAKLTVARGIVPFGKDIGYLPGGLDEKLTPWMAGIFDNLEYLTANFATRKNGDSGEASERIRELMDLKKIELCALTYIRGRSLPNQWIVIDEAQNLSKGEVKTIISRVGEGSKIIVLGDIEQIDNHRLNSHNNGLVHIINSFKGQAIYGHVNLIKSERSKLSELAVKLL